MRKSIAKKLQRSLRLQYTKLLRSKGGPRLVSLSFALGFATELLILPTVGIAYIVLIPLILLIRAVFKVPIAPAIIGHAICKIILLPPLLLPFAAMLGKSVLPVNVLELSRHWFTYLHTLTGMTILAVPVGIIAYFVALNLYRTSQKARLKKREQLKQKRQMLPTVK